MLALKQLAPVSAGGPIADFCASITRTRTNRMTEALLIAIDTLKKLRRAGKPAGVLEPISNDSMASDAVRGCGRADPGAAGTQGSSRGDGRREQASHHHREAGSPDRTCRYSRPGAARTPQRESRESRYVRPVAAKLSECVLFFFFFFFFFKKKKKKKKDSAEALTVPGSRWCSPGTATSWRWKPCRVTSRVACSRWCSVCSFPANKYGNRETLSTTIVR